MLNNIGALNYMLRLVSFFVMFVFLWSNQTTTAAGRDNGALLLEDRQDLLHLYWIGKFLSSYSSVLKFNVKDTQVVWNWNPLPWRDSKFVCDSDIEKNNNDKQIPLLELTDC